ncbi:DUF2946 family protein [Rhodoferax sp.]|uniref:DUF2946 family protein n=1 Tax=Rhodoferax sp. TaxID=50421 RepID=UPI002625965B|nr:DUF2946 family protein [Rhodoferax sp.]MDD2926251.1 DUF2946 family protein [Rhodoferax sp.]
MDDIVKQAMAKWPHVPDCYGWLGLDARGNWYMRDDRVQVLGAFDSGMPGSKGSQLLHDKLIAFIGRNYSADAFGQWFFQNGPQRVYVELQATPLIWRVQDDFSVRDHIGRTAHVQACVLDEWGHLYLQTDTGFGLVHTQDMALAADAVERGLWQPQEVARQQLSVRYGYVNSPQFHQKR